MLDSGQLCDQEEENIQHLLVGRVFSRGFWFSLLSRFGFATPHNLLTNPLMIGGEKLIVLLVGTMIWV
jgi:hypothetical protein